MDWRGRRGSRNLEDRRTSGRPGGGVRAGGIGGIGVIAVLVAGYFLGIDVTPLLQATNGSQGGTSGATVTLSDADIAAGEFVSVTLADTEEVWAQLFQDQLGRSYTPATLVLFKDVTQSPCGDASGATGPFYCPADRKAYLDTAFFTVLDQRLGAQGDFAAAYVVAHEIAHHVQNELGVLGEANTLRRQVSEADSNAISVRIELQADCLSGVWARTAAQNFGSISTADFKEAVNAARQIGDDTLQSAAGRRPMPHTFTHGTSDQRARWFTIGLNSGQIADCDTFSTDRL
jgi:predicted metalloprotease